MMLILGMFVFCLKTAPYQEFQRQTDWRHASNGRIGAHPARQFLGRGEDTITLPGVILPELMGITLSLDALRLMANTGKAWPLIEGSGRIYGLWVIESLSETKTIFFRDGAPRRIEFSLTLKRIDGNRMDLIGAATYVGVSLLRALL
ncbi:phage tail protein [Pseudomonas sp. NPDC098747]|uniref:phage tail protein n=1 Tax=Pseudomonas sp. NPDC098747 TaxID=3364487 RepID=UPI00383AD047